MPLQRPLWKVLMALAAGGGLFVAVKPDTVMSATATLSAAAALAGLVFCANRKNIGMIWRSFAWSLVGGVAGTAISPSPPLHPPLECLFGGILCGWAFGCVRARNRRIAQTGVETRTELKRGRG